MNYEVIKSEQGDSLIANAAYLQFFLLRCQRKRKKKKKKHWNFWGFHQLMIDNGQCKRSKSCWAVLFYQINKIEQITPPE